MKNNDVNDDYVKQNDEFSRRFNRAVDLMLARKFNVSIPTIDRWRRGVSSPHTLMQDDIFTALADMEPL